MKTRIKVISGGGITAPKGFRAAGVHCGIKEGKDQLLDLALIVSMMPAHAAAVFTSNMVKAAPVRVSQKHIAVKGRAQAIVANSGNANACTGEKGMKDALDMARLTAELLAVAPHEVLVASTGRIGVNLPMENVLAGIRAAEQILSDEGGAATARAIMTTDTVPKLTSRTVGGVRLGGMCKGAGMIHPGMATLLAFVTTDAAISRRALQPLLARVVSRTFNAISVDNDMSTNDTALVLANGASGKLPAGFGDALEDLFRELALKIVADGEGATKFVTITVDKAASEKEAAVVADAVACSMLVKTALFGQDPNWGRILAAVGRSGVAIDTDRVTIAINRLPIFARGLPASTPLPRLARAMKEKKILIRIGLGRGRKSWTSYTSDLSHGYVSINADYTT